MSKSPINFGALSAIGSSLTSAVGGGGLYGRMSDEQLRRQYDSMSRLGGGIGSFFGSQRNAIFQEIQRRQALGNFGMPQATASVSGGPGASFTDPNNTTTTGNFSINPNAGGSFANAVEATGAPGSDMGNFSDGSQGYAVNRFGGFSGPTGGGTVPANVATAENFSPEATMAAGAMFGNSTQFQPRKKLITL